MNRRMSMLACGAVIAVMLGVAPANAQFLYSGTSFGPFIESLNPATGATITSVGVSAAGYEFTQVKGLAAEPTTGELYAVLRGFEPTTEGIDSFYLGMVRPDTGAATVIGLLPDAFAGLAFDGAGTLYGVTGDGASVPETLYTINTSDASTTLFMSLGNGSDGEAIAFNSSDGMMYHLSGWEDFPVEGGIGEIVFEKIDLGTMAITNIPLSGDVFTNGNGLAFDANSGDFVLSVLTVVPSEGADAGFARISTAGSVNLVGPMNNYAGGMAFSDFVPVELMSFSVE